MISTLTFTLKIMVNHTNDKSLITAFEKNYIYEKNLSLEFV